MDEKQAEKISDKYDLAKFMIEPKKEEGDKLSSDFVIAKFSDQEREGIIELTHNREVLRNLLNRTIMKMKKWHYDQESKKWSRTTYDEFYLKKCKKIIERMYNIYYVRAKTMAVLGKNVSNNHIAKWVFEQKIEGEEEPNEKAKGETMALLKAITANEEGKQ